MGLERKATELSVIDGQDGGRLLGKIILTDLLLWIDSNARAKENRFVMLQPEH